MTSAQEWWRPTSTTRPETAPVAPSVPVAFGALILFTAILVLAPQTRFPVLAPLRIAFWVAGLASAAYVFDRLSHSRPLTIRPREIVLSMCLLGWAVLTVPFSLWPGGSIETLLSQYLKSLVIFWLLSNVVTSVGRFRRIAWVLSIISLPLSLTGVNNYVTGTFITPGDEPIHRIQGYEAGLTSNPNDLALMLNLILPLSVALLLTERRTSRHVLLLAIIASSLAAIVLTFSRGGFVTTAGIGLLYLWHFRRRPERRWVYCALLLALACLLVLPGTYRQRIETLSDVSADTTGSAEARLQSTVAALRFVLSHPVVGAGIGSDNLAVASWHNVHNAYLQYAVDLGVPGVTLFLLILFGCLRRLKTIRELALSRTGRTDLFYFAEGIHVTLSAFAIGALFHPVAYHFYFYYMAGLALGLSCGPGTQLTLAVRASRPTHMSAV